MPFLVASQRNRLYRVANIDMRPGIKNYVTG